MARRLSMLAGACRFTWNAVLADQEDLHRIAKMHGAKPPSVNYAVLSAAFTQLRRATPWLQELPYGVVRHTLKRQADAWQAHFKGQRGRPRFKARGAGTDGFTIPQGVCFDGEWIAIRRLGKVRLRRRGRNPYATGEPRTATFTRRNGKWYCTVAYAVAAPVKCRNGQSVGVDMNVGQVATSDGEIHRLPDVRRLEARKRRYQRMVARRQKGSNRRARAKLLLSKTSARLAAIRSDWQHQASHRIARRAETVCIEALNVKAMTAKGGSRKRGLNRSIRDTGWAGFRQKLEYKATKVVAVNPAYTSQTCSHCGHRSEQSRRSQSLFWCVSCGYLDNADVNAARNIMASELGATGRGGCNVGWPANRQNGSKEIAA